MSTIGIVVVATCVYALIGYLWGELVRNTFRNMYRDLPTTRFTNDENKYANVLVAIFAATWPLTVLLFFFFSLKGLANVKVRDDNADEG